MAAGAVPEVPVLAYLTIGLLAMLGYVAAAGLRVGWIYTFGAIFNAIGSVSILGAHPLGFVKSAGNEVDNALKHLAEKSQHAMGYFFHGAAIIQGWMAREMLALAGDVYGWATWLQRSHLPKWVKALIAIAVPPLILPNLIAALRHVKYGHLWTRIKVLERTVTHTVVHVVTKVASTGVALPGWAWRLPGRIGHIEGDLKRILRRLRSLEKYVGATGAVALFVAALSKLGLKWLRCRNVSKVGKQICGMDSSLLGELLTDGLLIVGTISVLEFAETLLTIEGEAVKILGAGIREFPGS